VRRAARILILMPITSLAVRIIGRLIDGAPGWLWRPSNLRFVGRHTVHFCYDGGRRTVELDGRAMAWGNRKWPQSGDIDGH